jgi:anti-sigma B factor antagonist
VRSSVRPSREGRTSAPPPAEVRLPRRPSAVEDNVEPDLQVSITQENGASIVAVTGELDAASTPQLEAPLRELMSAVGGDVVLDLSNCAFVDSTGLHVIIDARSTLEARGSRLALCCVEHGPVARVIEVALPGVLDLYPSRAAALASLA